MSRLTWGALDERFYETGVDRGVLYVGADAGVAWNGLVSVSESSSGGEAKPAYIDGYKFRNTASSEEFEATIEAFSAPREFRVCDGTRSIQNGLFATQQPRRAFSFSYRTKIGNAIEGADHGYKIHLVYNALAAPAERSNKTIGDSAEATTLSWSLTTLPPSFTGYKPTAHFVIDSRETPRGLLASIENILYGSDAAEARIPQVSELISLFQTTGPLTRRNWAATPSVETSLANCIPAGAGVTITASNTLMAPFGSKSAQVVCDGTVDSQGVQFTSPVGTYPAGTYVGSLYVNGPEGATLYANFRAIGSGAADTTSETNLVLDGTWQRIYANPITTTADSTQLSIMARTSGAQAITFYADGALIEAGNFVLNYFDGDTVDSDAYFYSWEGTPHESPSVINTWN